ncbi:hypothetical protein [Streptomyces sp. NPDC059076]|uniref:hypothetical protein n=1 Tax=unclassified Streptomyces TaxID=2593676 RepID=UPI0036D0C831
MDPYPVRIISQGVGPASSLGKQSGHAYNVMGNVMGSGPLALPTHRTMIGAPVSQPQ